MVVVGCAAILLAIVVPRPVLPVDIPLPIPDRLAIDKASAERRRLAQTLYTEPVSVKVRLVGEAFRLFGAAAAQGDVVGSKLAREALAKRMTQAEPLGRELLRLRAYQCDSFLRELQRFQASGMASTELFELSGDFLATITKAGWVRMADGKPVILVPEQVAEILFYQRWNDILAVKHPDFALSLDQQRTVHRFLFSHPPRSVAMSPNEASRNHQSARYLLRKVAAFGSVDPAYPVDYALGLLHLRLEQPEKAVEPLVRHLAQHPDGAYTLRARNALRYAQRELFNAAVRKP